MLVFVVVSVATDDRVHSSLAPVAVGAALAVAVLVAGPVTGGAVTRRGCWDPPWNPGQFTGLWIYLIAPPLGGIAAATVYHRFLAKAQAPA